MEQQCQDRCIPVVCKPERKRRYSGCGFINIDSGVVKTWVRIQESASAGAGQLVGFGGVSIEMYRKGQKDSFATYNAFSTDNAGNVSFYWDDAFLAREAGYYIGDVFLGGAYCFTLQFRIRMCEAVAVACQNEYEPTCKTGCENAIGADAPLGCTEPVVIPQDLIQTLGTEAVQCGLSAVCP